MKLFPRRTNTAQPDKRKIEAELKTLSGTRMDGFRCYKESDIGAISFPDWARFAGSVNDPDQIRNAIYYAFQPLYDALVRGEGGSRRAGAVDALSSLTRLGVKYLTGYYRGEPDVKLFRNELEQIGPQMKQLSSVRYETKFRNVDRNGINPAGIHSFLRQLLENALDGKTKVPDYVIGCACGSSEIVMPLSGILEVDLGFIRRSHRRGDDDPVIVPEHKQGLRAGSEGKNVLCVEDYVCTATSLSKVMERARSYGAASVAGASVNCTGSDRLRRIVGERKFNLFEFR